jgi:1-acyl-sn-glycerol-3-phosphate acyltransferase
LAAARIAAFSVFSVAIAVVGTVVNAFGADIASLRRWYFATAGRIVGLRVLVRGTPATTRPLLIVANHVSYLDIFALGGVAPGAFVAKADIQTWPVIGWLGRIGRAVFVDRRRAATGDARDDIRARLEAGDTLIMFPEATSNDGNRIRPFKSSLFNPAETDIGDGRPITVQPVSIAYTRLNGLPLGIGWRPFFAWYGDMDLMPHVSQALRLGTLTIEITFHPPVQSRSFPDRKTLARHCEAVAGAGMARLLMGREAA